MNNNDQTIQGLPGNCRAVLALDANPDILQRILAHCPEVRRVYHVRITSSRAQTTDARILELAAGDGELGKRLAEAFIADYLFFVEGRLGVWMSPEAARAHAETCTLAWGTFKAFAQKALSTAALHATRGWHMFANTFLNLPRLLRSGSIAQLDGLWSGEPVVMAGSGPALDDNVVELAAQRGRIRLIACDSACATLAKAGLIPDLIVSTDDSERVWRYFAALHGTPAAHAPLVCPVAESWPVVRHHQGPLFAGWAQSTAGQAGQRAFPELGAFDTGQCVGHAALEVALRMGGQPIILMGFNLAFQEGRFHPRDMALPYFHRQPPPPENLVKVPGINGEPVTTDLSMAFYLQGFEKRIAQAPGRIFNATGAGARIMGARPARLADVLPPGAKPLPPFAPPPPPRTLLQAWEQWPPLMARWVQAAEILRRDVNKRLNAPGSLLDMASRHPFPFLQDHREFLELAADTENPTEAASLHFAWEDHRRGVLHNREALENMARDHLADIDIVTHLFLALPSDAAPPARTTKSRAVLYGFEKNESFAALLRELLRRQGWAVEELDCAPAHLPEFWDEIQRKHIRALIVCRDAILPAAWGMPGLICLEAALQQPGELLPEHWLPGYGVLALTPVLAGAWRACLPKDRPIWIWQDARRPLLDEQGEGLTLADALAKLAQELAREET